MPIHYCSSTNALTGEGLEEAVDWLTGKELTSYLQPMFTTTFSYNRKCPEAITIKVKDQAFKLSFSYLNFEYITFFIIKDYTHTLHSVAIGKKRLKCMGHTSYYSAQNLAWCIVINCMIVPNQMM